MEKIKARQVAMVVLAAVIVMCAAVPLYGVDDSTRNVLKQGLLGAGTGAIAASASGGKAGQGALIGAGTSVIGSALLDSLTGPSSSSSSAPRRVSSAPVAQDDDYYYYEEQPEEYYEEPPQQSGSSNIIKQGLLGAGTGAIAAGASGGDAGKGALIGAGTSVIGNALLDTLTQPAEQRRGKVYRRIPKRQATQQQVTQQAQQPGYEVMPDGTRKKIIRKYDESGKVVSEEEIYY
ncbi:MAG: hypothetical protein WC515_01130 [Candidatus Omnitrophota bacterium]